MQRTKRGPGRPPGSTSDATRTKILSAARICFAREGFGVATNRDIAECAGITTGAIYQYFDSKVALYVAAAREAIAEVAGHMRAQGASEGGGVAALSGIVLGLLAVHEQDPSLTPFLSAFPAELKRHPKIARHFRSSPNDVLAITLEVVQRAVALGEIDAKDAPRVVAMFLACIMGLSQFADLAGPERATAAATAFTELLDGGLFRRVATRRASAVVTRRASRSVHRDANPKELRRRN